MEGEEGHSEEEPLPGLRLRLRGGCWDRCATQGAGSARKLQGRGGGGGGRRWVETRQGLSACAVPTLSLGSYHVQATIYSLIIHLPYLRSQPAIYSGGQMVLEAQGTPATSNLLSSEELEVKQPWSLTLEEIPDQWRAPTGEQAIVEGPQVPAESPARNYGRLPEGGGIGRGGGRPCLMS